MSPGQTFERVYLELKRQLREGTRPPGTPLEPTAIGDELGTSFTPVRDALHRLVGEGLVETPRHNGFAVPHPTEQALRDLYAWNGALIALVAALPRGQRGWVLEDGNGAAVADLFLALAEATGNREHARIVAQLNERLAPFRRVETGIFPEVADEARALAADAAVTASARFRKAIRRYHARRIAAVPQILERLQDTN